MTDAELISEIAVIWFQKSR